MPGLPGAHVLGAHPDTQAPITLGTGARGPYLLMIAQPGGLPAGPAEPGVPSMPSVDDITRVNIPQQEAAELTLPRAVELLRYPKARSCPG